MLLKYPDLIPYLPVFFVLIKCFSIKLLFNYPNENVIVIINENVYITSPFPRLQLTPLSRLPVYPGKNKRSQSNHLPGKS